MAAKLTNSSDESSMGSAVYFSRRVLTENLEEKQKGDVSNLLVRVHACVCVRVFDVHTCATVLEPGNNSGKEAVFCGIGAIFPH